MNLCIYIYKIFPISNDSVLNKQKIIQYHKIIELIEGIGKGIDPVKVSFSFSSYIHTDNKNIYSLSVLIFHFVTRRLNFRNIFLLSSYYFTKSVL